MKQIGDGNSLQGVRKEDEMMDQVMRKEDVCM